MNEFMIWFIASLISTFGVVYLFYKLLNIRFHINIYRVIILLLISFAVAYMQFFNLKFVNLITYFIFYPIYFLNYTEVNLKNTFIYIIIIWLIGGIFDCIFMLLLSLFINQVILADIDMVFYVLVATVFINLLFFILGKSKKFINSIKKLVLKLNSLIFIDILLLLFILFLFYIGIILFNAISDVNVSILISIIIIFSVFTFLILIITKLKNEETKIFLKTLKNNNDSYIKLLDEFKVFKHNFNNMLLSIKSVSNKNVVNLIDDLIYKYNKNVSALVRFEEVPYGLNGVVYEKIFPYLDKLNFTINNSVTEDIFEILKPSQYNVFVEKLGILIDNAISATLQTDEKFLQIDIYIQDNYIFAKVINSFSSIIDVDLLGSKYYSTNGNNRGLGLFSVLRNSNVNLKIEVNTDKFICILKLKTKF